MITDKKKDSIFKAIGKELMDGLDELSPDELKERVVNAQDDIRQAKNELEASPEYQKAKEAVSDLSAGLRELRKHRNALVEYSLHLLEEKGCEEKSYKNVFKGGN